MSRDELVFTRLHLPRPLDPARVVSLLVALASERRSPIVVFEARADADGVCHLVGCAATNVHALHRQLRDHLPTIAFSSAGNRPAADESARLTLRPASLPLRSDNPLDTTRALLSALGTRLHRNDSLVVQAVLGPRQAPRLVAPNATDPDFSWIRALSQGTAAAAPEKKRLMSQRLSEAGFSATLRVGVATEDPERTRRLMVSLHSALSTARNLNVRLDFLRENPRHLNAAVPPRRWPLHLAAPELVGLLAWPLGDDELPGVPALHPRPLRPSAAVHTGERVFATSAAPGDSRSIGIAAADSVLHGVAYGPSGSGKTTAMLNLIVADMKAGRPVAVLDPKRQLIDDILARVPADRVDDVVVLDVGDEAPAGFNPLDVTDRDPDVVVDGILAVFGSLFTDGWGPRTLDIFSGALRTLARSSVGGEPATLADVPRILTDPGFRRARLRRITADDGLASFWAWYEDQSAAAQAAAISAPLNKLRQLLLRPALVRMLDQPDARFRLRDIWRSNKIVLCPLNEGLIGAGTASMLGSLIVADLWQSVQERASEKRPESRPGLVYIDEAPRFLHLPNSLADALAVSRSLGVGWFLAAQFRGQFPTGTRSAIDMNARSKLVFATEYEDAAQLAKSTKLLDAEDFMLLPRFHAYANLVAGGQPQGWALVRTLAPPATTSAPGRVLARSRAQYGALPPEPGRTAKSAQAAAADASGAPGAAPGTATGPDGQLRVGRKRRET